MDFFCEVSFGDFVSVAEGLLSGKNFATFT